LKLGIWVEEDEYLTEREREMKQSESEILIILPFSKLVYRWNSQIFENEVVEGLQHT
jgi:hypothetical protein